MQEKGQNINIDALKIMNSYVIDKNTLKYLFA